MIDKNDLIAAVIALSVYLFMIAIYYFVMYRPQKMRLLRIRAAALVNQTDKSELTPEEWFEKKINNE